MSALAQYLDLINETQKAFAARYGLTQGAVSQWAARGVPAERVLPVCAQEDWRITPHLLRPDLYPNPSDGLPGLRCPCHDEAAHDERQPTDHEMQGDAHA
jgi:DNA-binding transcriptional regulator YdaS (Cro superfamily)